MEPRLNFFKASPEAIKAMNGLEQHRANSGLEKPLVELVRLRASQVNGCAYCIDAHTGDARKAGESERRLATFSVWRETPFFSERVPNGVWEQVKQQFTPAELVDLTLLVNTINSWNRFAIAFRKLPA
jgi:AhpD family alkylhydroperoxidase